MNLNFTRLQKVMIVLLFTLIIKNEGFTQVSVRSVEDLKSEWLFIKNENIKGSKIKLDERKWEKVTIPHDWSIKGPFDKNNDLQEVKVIEDGETKNSVRTGRTGGLPYLGVGWYRKHLKFSKSDQEKNIFLEFDGAMSNAKIYLNDEFVGEWPYGYSSFNFEITKLIKWNVDNILSVRLENLSESARWYPGAGIYRNVRLVKTNPVHIAHWGTFIKTNKVTDQISSVEIETEIKNQNLISVEITLQTILYDAKNQKVGEATSKILSNQEKIIQKININNPKLWSAETPYLYHAQSIIKTKNLKLDHYNTSFGIRYLNFKPDSGMFVNDVQTKLKGVCMHHDLGPLGSAINKSALRFRLNLLKEMGCNAIRGTHNPQAPELLELCDEMGFYFIDEAFDEWKAPKVAHGYHLLFDDWAKKDLEAMILRDRNHPALIMYSIGNEVREQELADGGKTAKFLTNICHALDSTRPVTAGFNNWENAIKNGLADAVDIPGWNYKPKFYQKIHSDHPNWVIYGSETASTVSSRGVYKLPAQIGMMKKWTDLQSSSYDLEYCNWSQLPDTEWASQEKNNFVAGEFVWTGFDYLGEPTPYMNSWPSRSSYFGIIDLSGIPKDRYYLYQSHWSTVKMLHILPHWNWEGKEGEIVPVYAYSNYPVVELFINGKSFGKRTFNKKQPLDQYRLRWENAIYQPGELKVVAYADDGTIAESKIIKTAGIPFKIQLISNTKKLLADDEDMAFVTVTVQDKEGNTCPINDQLINFKVSGNGSLAAVGNGDPTSTDPFNATYRKAFYGKCMAIIKSSNQKGEIIIEASGEGLKTQYLTLKTQK